MNKSAIACSALVLVLFAGGMWGVAEADARGCPYMGGAHGSMHQYNITDEQRAQAQALVEAAQEKMRPLRDQNFVKKQELEALKNAANPDVQAVVKTAQEIVALREQLRVEKEKLGDALDKALGLPEGTHNMGHGMKHGDGYGRGEGRGEGRGRGHGNGHGDGMHMHN